MYRISASVLKRTRISLRDAFLMMVLLSFIGCSRGATYESLPRADEPVPEPLRAYLLAYGNEPVEDFLDTDPPDEFISEFRDLRNGYDQAKVAQDNYVSASVVLTRAALVGDLVAMKAAEDAYDAATEDFIAAIENLQTLLDQLDTVHRRYLNDYGITPPASYREIEIAVDVGWILTEPDHALKLENAQWQETKVSLEANDLLANDLGWFAVGVEAGLVMLSEDGKWESVAVDLETVPNLHAVVAGPDDSVWAVGEQGVVLRYGADRWEVLVAANEEQVTMYDIDFDAEGTPWSVGVGGAVLSPRPGTGFSEAWLRKDIPESDGDLIDVLISGETIWSIETTGHVWVYEGDDWRKLYVTPVGQALTSLTADHKGNIWIVGEDGIILQCSIDGCESEESPTSYTLLDITFGEDGWIVGNNNTILRLEEGGTWIKVVDWEMLAAAK